MRRCMTENPHALFDTWLAEAEAAEPNDPNAVAVATVGADGMPSVRMVLLKGHDARGFVFYTNQQSRKAGELASDPQAALLFHWKSLRRQVRIEGPVSLVSAQRPTPIGRAAAGIRSSAPGRRTSRARSIRARRSSGASRTRPRASRAATCRARRIGAATASRRCASSSGRTATTASTNAGCSRATARVGPKGCCSRDEHRLHPVRAERSRSAWCRRRA